MSAILDGILTDPDGVWVRPENWPPEEEALEGFDPTTGTHDPVVHVTLVTPNGGNDPVTWEAWTCTPISGSVTWDARGFPRGRATIEIPPESSWAPADDPPAGQTEVPTTSEADGIPWAVTPWGTLVVVHYGWRVDGDSYGVRLFDGMVTGTELARPGRTWVLTCEDFTTLMDGVLFHPGRFLANLTGAPSMPPLDDDDGMGFRKAVRFMAREASEYWWPMPYSQLAWDDVDERDGIYSFTFSDLNDGNDPPDIAGDTDMGGQSAWGWVEAWGDLYGVEAVIVPGARGDVRVAAPATDQDGDPRHTFTGGPGGNLISWRASYERIVTRALMTIETRDALRTDTGDVEWSPATGGYGQYRVRARGLSVDVWWECGGGSEYETPFINYVLWDTVNESEDEDDWDADDFTQDVPRHRFRHTYGKPGTYTITIAWGAASATPPTPPNLSGEEWTFDIEVSDQPLQAFGIAGAPDMDVDEASTVRRTGRKVWAGSRTVPNKWRLKDAEDRADQADTAAARMKARVRGRERARTFQVVPAPWLVPGDVIEAELTDGAATQSHIIESTTVPLVPSDSGMTIETAHRDLA